HCVGSRGTETDAQRCRGIAPAGGTLASSHGSHRRTHRNRRGAAASDQALFIVAGGRSASLKRGASFQRQTWFSCALNCFKRREVSPYYQRSFGAPFDPSRDRLASLPSLIEIDCGRVAAADDDAYALSGLRFVCA